MKSSLSHLQLNIDFKKNNAFYKELMTFLGWNVIHEGEDSAGYIADGECSVWFLNAQRPETSDFDTFGMNHIAFKVENTTEVDNAVEFIKQHNLEPLFETPRHRPEFSASETDTYYQVMFKTSDNLLFEIVYTGPKP